MNLLMATLTQIVEAPKPKAPRRARKSSIKARIERERSEPKLNNPKQSNAKRQEAALAKWRAIFLGNELSAEQAADAAKCKLAGAYSAINRLRAENRLVVARIIPRTGIVGRNKILWTWNTKTQ